jgi:hypothetical protein
MNAAQILTHVADAQARLLQQFRSKPLIAGLAGAIVTPIQTIEDAMFSVDSGRQLGTAVGAQLDGIGALLGTPRSGLGDDQYRALLYGTLAEDNSDTTLTTLSNIILSVFGAVAVFVDAQLPGGNVGFGIGSPSVPTSLFPMLQGIVLKSVAAGVEVSFLMTFNAYNAFAMAGNASWVQGCGDVYDPTVGGLLGSVIYHNP